MTTRRLAAALVAASLAASLRAQAPACPPPPEPSWCEVSQAGPDGVLGTGDDRPDCLPPAGADLATTCDTHEDIRWFFNDVTECADCLRVLHAQVAAGTELWLMIEGEPGFFANPIRPYQRASGTSVRVRVTSLATGADLPLLAENECAVRASWPLPGSASPAGPFTYCDDCAVSGRFVPRNGYFTLAPDPGLKPYDTCDIRTSGTATRTAPERPCLQWSATGTVVAWGSPLDPDGDGNFDEDGDGIVDAVGAPPCVPCAAPACPCGATSLENPVFTGQAVRIRVPIPAAEPRVVRIEMSGGGGHWSVGARCTVEAYSNPTFQTPELRLYDTCSAALAAHAAAPALPLLVFPQPPSRGIEVVDDTACPDRVRIALTACNEGAVAASPVNVTVSAGLAIPEVTFDLTAHPSDPACQGPLAAGDCRTCEYDVDLSGATTLRARMDEADAVTEADELYPPVGCSAGADEVRTDTCGGPCVPRPGGSATPAVPCVGSNVVIDAAASQIIACGGAEEYLLESPPGMPVPPFTWTTTPQWTLLMDSVGPRDYWVRFRCPARAGCEGLTGPLHVDVAERVAFPSAVVATPEGECALRVSWEAATGGGPITYDVYRSDSATVPIDAAHRIATGLTATSLLDPLPWSATASLRYRVEAAGACERVLNGGGDSAPAAPADPNDPVFAGVTGADDLGGCRVEVTWGAATDSCSGIVGFNVYRDNGVAHAGDTLVASLVPASPYVDTPPGTATWVYLVRAVDAAGNEDDNPVFERGHASECSHDFPRDASLLAGSVASAGAGRLRLRWSPSPDEGGVYPVTYAVLRGELARLREGVYTHVIVEAAACGLTTHEYVATAPDDGVAAYYLVASVSGESATFGYDSLGRRIPGDAPCP